MTSASSLAKYIIARIKREMKDVQLEEFDVTPLKLQKLLYYCQGYALALTGKPAFPEKIEAWKYGPVVESVYQEYKKYNGGIIPYREIQDDSQPDETLQGIVKLVLCDKLRYNGETLARATHKEAPWQESYEGEYTNAEIPSVKIKDYFTGVFERREADYEDEDEAWGSIAEAVSISDVEAALEEI